MFCRKCGAQIDDDSDFCPACGIQVGEPTDQPKAIINKRKKPSLLLLVIIGIGLTISALVWWIIAEGDRPSSASYELIKSFAEMQVNGDRDYGDYSTTIDDNPRLIEANKTISKANTLMIIFIILAVFTIILSALFIINRILSNRNKLFTARKIE